MKILTICPTYNRPELCRNMVDSFRNTIQCDNALALGIDIGDKRITEYKEIKEANRIFCKANSTVTQVINSIYTQHPNYDYYHITNDDVVYRTKGWDKKMTYILEEYGGGIAYGNDLLQEENLPTFPLISCEIVKALGWLQLPTLNRYAGDVTWKFIGEQCKCLYYLPGVVLQHKWVGCESPEVNKSDMAEFAKWLPWSFRDIAKVKEVLDAAKC